MASDRSQTFYDNLITLVLCEWPRLKYLITSFTEDIACAFEELNAAITSGELNEAIKQLKSGKSSGEDLLLNEFFIYGHQELMPYVLHLFNHVLNCGIFPDAWSDGLLVPLLKKGTWMYQTIIVESYYWVF